MLNREVDLAKLKAMQHRDVQRVAWSEEGGGEVHHIWNTYILYCIPQYGGEGDFVRVYDTGDLEDLLDTAYSWS